MPPHPQWADDQLEEMLKRMGEGEHLTGIAKDSRMPCVQTMMNWEAEQDTDLGLAITRARARGYTARAEAAVVRAQTADGDPGLKRLDFDAERWFLGKMAPKKFGDATTVKHADADGEKIALDDTSKYTRLAAIALQITAKNDDAPDDAG
jgi:hypothetical protein